MEAKEIWKNFLELACNEIDKWKESGDDTPLKSHFTTLTNEEVEAECLDLCQQYLVAKVCPPSLLPSLCHMTCADVLAEDLSEYKLQDDEEEETKEGPGEPNSENETDKMANSASSLDDLLDGAKISRLIFDRLCQMCIRCNTELPVFPVSKPAYEISVHSIRNTRRKMEDRHVIIPDLNSLFGLEAEPAQSFYAVYDGHGGIECANYTATHLHCNLVRDPAFSQDITQATKSSYNLTDDRFIKKASLENLRSGSTCVTALIQDRSICLSWLGDSQAFLVRGGQTVTLMDPHKPERPDEKRRIEQLGGCVVWFGTWRVNGNIAVSRAIGDAAQKPYVSNDADAVCIDLDGTEDYLVLACDGAWDTVPPEDLPHLVYNHIKDNGGDRSTVAHKIVSVARESGSSDNITVIVVFFKDQISKPAEKTPVLFEFGGTLSEESDKEDDDKLKKRNDDDVNGTQANTEHSVYNNNNNNNNNNNSAALLAGNRDTLNNSGDRSTELNYGAIGDASDHTAEHKLSKLSQCLSLCMPQTCDNNHMLATGKNHSNNNAITSRTGANNRQVKRQSKNDDHNYMLSRFLITNTTTRADNNSSTNESHLGSFLDKCLVTVPNHKLNYKAQNSDNYNLNKQESVNVHTSKCLNQSRKENLKSDNSGCDVDTAERPSMTIYGSKNAARCSPKSVAFHSSWKPKRIPKRTSSERTVSVEQSVLRFSPIG